MRSSRHDRSRSRSPHRRSRHRYTPPPPPPQDDYYHRDEQHRYKDRHYHSKSSSRSAYDDRYDRHYSKDSSKYYENDKYSSERKDLKRKREEETPDPFAQQHGTTTGVLSGPSPTSATTPNVEEEEKKREAKRARLEAWKKKVEDEQILTKLKEEQEVKQKLQQEEQIQLNIAAAAAQEQQQYDENVSNALFKNPAARHLHRSKFDIDFSVPTDGYKEAIDDEEDNDSNKYSADKVKQEEEEEDPLDAYMKEVESQAHVSDPRNQVITLEEIQKLDTGSLAVKQENGDDQDKMVTDEYDDDSFHKSFVDAIKNNTLAEAVTASNKALQDEKEELLSDEDDDYEKDIEFYKQLAAQDNSLPYDEAQALGEGLDLKNKKELKPVDHSKVDYPEFRKNFYVPAKEIARMMPSEIEDARKTLRMRVRGRNVPVPVKTWTQCGLNDAVLEAIQQFKYDKPFAIQAQAIPCIMAGRNVIGIAKTGSGKTLAFLLPMIRHVLDQPDLQPGDGPIGLVIAPTHELCVQIFNELKKFAKPCNLRCVAAYGGASIADQISALKRGAHIVVCTPGRMIDLLCSNRGKVTNLKRTTYVVLDEADRMFDLGFGPQITRIIDNVRPDRQMVMFSATFPKQLEALAKKTMKKNCIEIIVGGRSVATDQVKQFVEIRTDETKFLRLLELLGQWYEKGSILVFVDKQAEAGDLFKELQAAGYDVLSLHGGMDQLDRNYTLESFKSKEKNILIATSVAARGLDVRDLNLVINYNCPNHYEDYVHRIGRTGRANKTGTAYTFITPEEDRHAPDLVRALTQSNNPVPPELEKLANDYKEKMNKGLVKKQSALPGFVGTGYKFDESESKKKKEEMKRQAISAGADDEVLDALGAENKDAEGTTEEGKKEGDANAVTKDAATKPTDNPIANIMKARQFAQKLAIKDRFTDEFEINDYPQNARWRVTHKDALYEINEASGCGITPKGVHVDHGKNPPPGERRLYLLIEGSSQEQVDRAKKHIRALLEEQVGSVAEYAPGARLGRFKVV